jgi:hypothetical protein
MELQGSGPEWMPNFRSRKVAPGVPNQVQVTLDYRPNKSTWYEGCTGGDLRG